MAARIRTNQTGMQQVQTPRTFRDPRSHRGYDGKTTESKVDINVINRQDMLKQKKSSEGDRITEAVQTSTSRKTADKNMESPNSTDIPQLLADTENKHPLPHRRVQANKNPRTQRNSTRATGEQEHLSSK